MFCTNCGKEINPEAIICVHCGAPTKNNVSKVASGSDDGGALWLIVGLLIPVVGLILYLVWKEEKPRTASQAGKGALIGFIINVIFTILSFVLMFILPFMPGLFNWIIA